MKGVSFEEKRKRMYDFFFEKKDFFQLKELEKYLPKEKGIVAQSVKEVLQSLVDDRLVNSEKIGTSNYFWSFPSNALQTRKVKIETLENELENLKKNELELRKQIEESAFSRDDTGDRALKIQQLSLLESTYASNQAELKQFEEFDPDLFDQKKSMMKEAKLAVDRWTDNVFAVQSYCASNFGISRADFSVQFGIPEEFDYLA